LVEKGAWMRVVVKTPKGEAEQIRELQVNSRDIGLRFGSLPVVVGREYLIGRCDDMAKVEFGTEFGEAANYGKMRLDAEKEGNNFRFAFDNQR
jgi:hypothetical protein